MSDPRPGFATLAALRAYVESTHDLRAAERLLICETLQGSNHVAGIFTVLGLPLEPSVLPMAEPEPDPSRPVEAPSEAAQREANEREAAFRLGVDTGIGRALSEVIRARDVARVDALRHKSPVAARRARQECAGIDTAVEALAVMFAANSL